MTNNTSALLVYHNKKGELRTTYVDKTDDNIIGLLDDKWSDIDARTELGYHGALKSIGGNADDFVYYDAMLGGRCIPCKQNSWLDVVNAVDSGEYDTAHELRTVIVFDSGKWVIYPCGKYDPERGHFARLAAARSPTARYKVTMDVTVNSTSESDAKLMILSMLNIGDELTLCGIRRNDRNMKINAKRVQELSVPTY